jgi:hypothetical protein
MEVDRNPPGFENFDDPDVYQRSEEYLLKADALNFAIIFDSDEAIAAVELTAASFDALLGTKVRPFAVWWTVSISILFANLSAQYVASVFTDTMDVSALIHSFLTTSH